jgi:nitroreductase
MDVQPSVDDPGLFETIFSTRAMRRLRPDPVPRELIEKILRAGQAAPSGGNTQEWGFVIVESPQVKAQIQVYYKRVYDEFVAKLAAGRIAELPNGPARDKLQRQYDAVRHLTEHLHEAPVLIIPCLKVSHGATGQGAGASIYPAAQNMLLAARALGLGATLTTRHIMYRKEVDAILGLPDEMASFAIIPIGYPTGKFGPVARGPLEEVTHYDRWGQRAPTRA